MQDRQPTKPNRIKITFDDGSVKYGYMERADEPTVEGTPLNKNSLFNSKNSERFACELPSEAFEIISRDIAVTVLSANWSEGTDDDGYHTNRVDVDGISATHNPIFALKPTNAGQIAVDESDFSDIKRMTTYDGYVVFKATTMVASDLDVIIKGV